MRMNIRLARDLRIKQQMLPLIPMEQVVQVNLPFRHQTFFPRIPTLHGET